MRKEPRPKATLARPRREWNVSRWIDLGKPTTIGAVDFFDVLAARRSQRAKTGLPFERAGILLWHACRVRDEWRGRSGGCESRPYAGAGGIHEIDVVLVHNGDCFVYDGRAHRLGSLVVHDATAVSELGAQVVELAGGGTPIVLFADAERLESAYDDSVPLLRRDSGIAAATIELTATALGMRFCHVGISGVWLQRALKTRRVAVGVASVGDVDVLPEASRVIPH